MIELKLPYPPSVNHYYRRVGGQTLISRDGRAYRKTVATIIKPRHSNPLLGRLKVTIFVHPPDLRRRDLDNVLKSLLDALQHAGVYGDDSQIDYLAIIRCKPIQCGLVKVAIEEIKHA